MLNLGGAALTAFLCAQALLANLFVLKQISLCGWNATASDIYIVGSVLSLNLLQEYFGKNTARTAIWISFILLVFYTLVSQIHIWYIPHCNDFTQAHYELLLSYMPRITIASLIVYLIVQHFDLFFYSKLKYFFNDRSLLLRNIISISVSQLLDTILFSFLGLYGVIQDLGQVMIVSYIIKLVTIMLLVPIIILCIKKVNSPAIRV